jgi:hypothetical protein
MKLRGLSPNSFIHVSVINLYIPTFGLSVLPRVSFETSFDLKQPKLEPKLVSALSETWCLFRLFRFYIETESFDVSIEPKQTEDQPKQFDRERILLFFTENLVLFQFFRFFLFFQFFSVCFETVCFGCFASIPKQRVSMFRLNQNKQKTHPNSLCKREYIWVFYPRFLRNWETLVIKL